MHLHDYAAMQLSQRRTDELRIEAAHHRFVRAALRHAGSTCSSPPTYGSWLNLVERWQSALTTRKLHVPTTGTSASSPTSAGGSRRGTPTRSRSCGTRTAEQKLNSIRC